MLPGKARCEQDPKQTASVVRLQGSAIEANDWPCTLDAETWRGKMPAEGQAGEKYSGYGYKRASWAEGRQR